MQLHAVYKIFCENFTHVWMQILLLYVALMYVQIINTNLYIILFPEFENVIELHDALKDQPAIVE